MKFIFVGSEKQLNLNKIGGIEKIISELALGLIRNSHEVEFFIHSKSTIHPSAFSNLQGIKEKIGSKREIRRLIIKSNADHYIFLESLFQSPLFFLRFYLKSKMNHFSITKLIFTYPSIKGNIFLEKFKFRILITSAIVFSERLKNDLQKFWNGKIFIMYPPVSNDYSYLKEGNKKEKRTIGYIGRLSEDKGIIVLKEIINELNDGNFNFLISGYFTGNEKPEFNLNGENIQFEIVNQNIADNSLIAPLKEIDILILPYQFLDSKTVDTPLLILEGLSAGCIVVTSNLESLRGIHPAVRLIDNYDNAESFIRDVKNIDCDSYERPDCSQFSTDLFLTKFLQNLGA